MFLKFSSILDVAVAAIEKESFEFAGFVEILNNGTVSGRNSMTFVVMVVFVCGITETYARVHVCSCGCLPLRAPAVLKHDISVGKIPWLKINLSFVHVCSLNVNKIRK